MALYQLAGACKKIRNMNNRSAAFLVQKFLCYLGIVIVSCMVEDLGQFRIALLISIIVSEVALHYLQKTRPKLGRPWVAPVLAFILTNLLLLIGGIWSLINEWLEG
jgi:hypothetical protein